MDNRHPDPILRGVTQLGQSYPIVRPEPAAVRTVWPSEAVDFTPWLANNLDWLEPLGLGPLELVGTEVLLPTVNRALDILARAADDRLVAIENQYLRSDHDHLTRGLAYAIGHEAKALLVIAESHGDEFVAIADYLNKAYEQLGPDTGIAVFLVGLAVERVGDAYVPRFTAVARPNTWITTVRAGRDSGTGSVTAFVDALASPIRDAAREIIQQWMRRPGASLQVNRSSSSVSLNYPYLLGGGPRSVFVLYTTGIMTVNRGYFIELGSLPEHRVEQLDAALLKHFPSLSNKPYYPSVAAPDPDQTRQFADWLISWIGAPTPTD